ncbi:xylosyl- and glucuronyltransferase LARGE1-like [Glandiceps talaboti]
MHILGKIIATVYGIILTVQIVALLLLLRDDQPQIQESDTSVETVRAQIYEDCEEIHILSHVRSYEDIRHFAIQVKSIVMHTKHRINFHVIVSDDKFKTIVTTLMHTWQLPAVLYSCDTVTQFVLQSHDLTLPYNKVIVIDLMTTFIKDITNLWNEFYNFDSEQLIGVIQSHQHFKLDNENILLLYLEKLPLLEEDLGANVWEVVFFELSKEELDATSLNSKLFHILEAYQEEIIYWMPCTYNVDLTGNVEDCVGDLNEVVSFTPGNHIIANDDVIYQRHFWSIYQGIAEHDGNLLRSREVKCQTWVPRQRNITNRCFIITQRESLVLRTHMYYLGNKVIADDDYAITMAMQADYNRFMQMIDMVILYWPCPMSIAVYATDEEAARLLKLIKYTDALSKRKDIAIHIVYIDRDFDDYPVNHLRNVAQEGVTTEYLFVSEVDFFYSDEICQNLRYLISRIDDRERTMYKKAIVVPTFESSLLTDRLFPKSKEELVEKYINGEYDYFHRTKYPPGHKPTDYERWLDATEEYMVRWNRGYEPYLVLQKENSPTFPTIFSGRGFNKGSHTMILAAQGYRLIVSPDTFMMHMPHWVSSSRKMYEDNEHYQRCLSWAKVKFDQSLYNTYNVTYSDLRRSGL